GVWTRPYVKLILGDRRAVGEFQPRMLDHDRPAGPPVPNYFPAAVTEEEFLLARAAQGQRRTYGSPPPPARRAGQYGKLCRSLLVHARDGEGFLLHNKGTAREPELLLINATGNGGRGRSYTFPYAIFEKATLRRLREVDPRDVMPREGEGPSCADVLRT